MNAKDMPDKPNATKTSKWKVYFDGNFWGHHGHERVGMETDDVEWRMIFHEKRRQDITVDLI